MTDKSSLTPLYCLLSYSEVFARGLWPMHEVLARGGAYLGKITLGVYETELIRRRRPWKGPDDVEYSTLEWVDSFNHRRILEPVGDVPPAEFEAAYRRKEDPRYAAGLKDRASGEPWTVQLEQKLQERPEQREDALKAG